MEDIVISAPGKVILHGEHAVVHKRRALAASLNLRTFLRCHCTDDGKVSINLPDIKLQMTWTIAELKERFKLPFSNPQEPDAVSSFVFVELQKFIGVDEHTVMDTHSLALVSFLYLFGSIAATDQCIPSMSFHIASSLPPGAGLGSSAAFSTCLASCLLQYRHLVDEPTTTANPHISCWSAKDLELINLWAFQCEKIIHGTPSGIDNSISTYGGALSFQAGKIMPLTKVPQLRILLINTKVPRSTKVLVGNVREKLIKYPAVLEEVLDAIEAISQRCESLLTNITDKLTQDDYNILNDLVDMNQNLLRLIGVSHPSLECVCQLASSHGLQCKLTGAGGGGCAFILISPQTTEAEISGVRQGAMDVGYECWETSVGGPGVVKHDKLTTDTFFIPAAFNS